MTSPAVDVPLTSEELVLILDHLAAGQLAKTYNLFNRLAKVHAENFQPQSAPVTDTPVQKE